MVKSKKSAAERKEEREAAKDERIETFNIVASRGDKAIIDFIVERIKELRVKCGTDKVKDYEPTKIKAHALCGYKKVIRDHGQSLAKGSKFAVPV